MDVDTTVETVVGVEQHRVDSPVDTLTGVESKKHRMQTGQDSDDFSSRYQLLEQLGSGASGTVWKCRLAPGQAARDGRTGDDPLPGKIYAAKIIDLRPFKLRERFSMQRLMREVDIMQRLRHPNIIRLVEALDTPEQLVLVLEYAPGVELFDAILAKTSFSEDEARPVFVQVARALQYMHSKQIVHRDVKPENVMIIDRPTEDGLHPEAKLLDFGLSKAIDADMGGSVARTFVGTPSYLAPEVEERKGGKGRPYGTPVDCWSLGAMLYVMLVARFPEFQVQGMRKIVRMHGPLWDKVSSEAKELIQNLMAFDAGARLTVEKALRHPWLGELAARDPPPSPVHKPTVPTGMQATAPIPENFAFAVPPEVMRAGAAAGGGFNSPSPQASLEKSDSSGKPWSESGKPPIVTEQETPPAASKKKKPFGFTPTGPTIRELDPDESPLPLMDHGMGQQPVPDRREPQSSGNSGGKDAGGGPNGSGNVNTTNGHGSMHVEEGSSNNTAIVRLQGLQVGLGGAPPADSVPLLQLQERITAVMETAVETYSAHPEGTASLRRSAALCRESLRESVTLLRKIEHTAAQVITLFPDLTLAVEEGEPELAHDFFSTVKTWVREMYTAVNVVQARNNANALKVGESMKKHVEMGREDQRKLEEELRRQPRDVNAASGSGTSYVSTGGVQGSQEPNGNAGGGATVQMGENHIALDPETFEVVRQIQALRETLSGSNSSSTASGAAGPSTPASAAGGADDAEATAAGANPSQPINDEKLINLFLRMSEGGSKLPTDMGGGTGGGNSGGSSGGEGPTVSARTAEESKGSRQGQGMHVDTVVDSLAAQMSIDDGMGAPRTDAAGGIHEERVDQSPAAWAGGGQLAHLQKDKIYAEVQRSLQMLHEIDSVLEHLALFWANSEVIFDVLLKKSDLVEKFVAFANKPRLLQRFRDRLAEYKRYWEGVQTVCCMYVCGQRKCGGVGVNNSDTTETGEGRGTTYDGSFNASSNRTNSQSSTGSQGAGETGGIPPMGGLGGGGWGTVETGMDGTP